MLTFFNKLSLLFFLSVLTGPAFAQNDTSFLSLLYNVIRTIQPSGIIYYAEKVKEPASPDFLSSINVGFADIQKHGLKLTAEEKKHVLRELKKSDIISWPDSLFLQSKRMGGDTIVRFVDHFNYAERPWAFFFGHPIYLRNNTILMFYFKNFRTSAGGHMVRIYKKENHQWQPWGRFGGGDW